jgi:amino acid transporter
MNVSILGVLPWQAVAATEHVATDLMLQTYGPRAANLITLLIVWTALASTFAAMLSYSRVPYASAKAGHFFPVFARLHPRGEFPHLSLLLIGGLAALACLADLTTVIAALLTSRILIQFVGQIATLLYLRRQSGSPQRTTFRMPLFPLPALVALLGWLFIFGTSEPAALAYGLGSIAVGYLAFRVWDRDRSPLSEPGDTEPEAESEPEARAIA